MTTPTCWKCGGTIPGDGINVARDVAYCRACNLTHELSALAHGTAPVAGLDASDPPPGAWLRVGAAETSMGASNYSRQAALFFLGFSLCWMGGISMLLLHTIAGAFLNSGSPVPDWLPEPKVNQHAMSVGDTIFAGVFLIFMVLFGCFLVGNCLSVLLGRTELVIGETEGEIFVGVGRFGWRARFDPRLVTKLRIVTERRGKGGNPTLLILEQSDGKQLKFGSLLTDERLQFVAAALRRKLFG